MMKQLGWMVVALLALSACASNTVPQQRAGMDWNKMTSSTKVAKVSNIKSLITPGFY